MGYTLVAAVLCMAILRLSEGVAPTITGGNTQTLEIAENVADGGPAFALNASAETLFTLAGTDAGSFAVTPTTSGVAGVVGTVTINASPVYATKSSYSLNVVATESAAPKNVTTVAVTLNVIKTPAFTSTTFTVTPCDGATASTVVATASQLTATGHPLRTFEYAIASGNTGTNLAISTTTGQISVAASKTLVKATTANYTLVVTAAYTTAPVQTATTTVTVNVSDTICSGSAAITGSLTALLCMIFSIIQKLA